MSLIITSSNRSGETNQYQVDAPYHYRNDFRSGMKIAPNSQIAVESVKINRQAALDYESGQVTNFWFGERLTENASLDNSLSYMIPSINTIKKNLSPVDFSEDFAKIIKTAYAIHPEIDTVGGVSMDPIVSTTGGFAGFQYNINQVGVSASDLVPPSGTEVAIFGSVDYGGGTITAEADDLYCQLHPQDLVGGPISLFGGELQYSNFSGTGDWVVGLARPIINTGADYGLTNPQIPIDDYTISDGLGKSNDQFYDYAVESRDGEIRLYHAVPHENGGGGGQGTLQMREINYYVKTSTATEAGNGDNSSFASGSPIPSASISDITFKVENEIVTISASGKTICKANNISSASFKDQVPKPLNQSCWKMYPTVGLFSDRDEVEISKYNCRTGSTIQYNKVVNTWAFKCNIHADMDTIDESFDPALFIYLQDKPWNNAHWWTREIEARPPMKRFLDSFGNILDPPWGSDFVKPYKGLSTKALTGHEPLFICGKTDRYTSNKVQEWQPNSTKILGFDPFAIAPISNSVSDTTGSASFSSATKPSMTSENSTFIRVPTFTHQTFNFGTGNPSKILFQIPRFDNSGAESGALYFQNQDKAYIDLNNPQEINVTDLDVAFVRKDEKFATDLTGSSEVVFYIRDKPKM